MDPTDHTHPTRRTLLAFTAGAAGAAAAAATIAAPASAATPANAAGETPTVVLVHGAWADASSWGQVVPRLEARGYTVRAVPNPLRNLAGDAAYVRAVLDSIKGPIVLVGHSYGGAVITNAALGATSVKALVFIDAFAPASGEYVLALSAAQPGSDLAADPTTVFDQVTYPGGGGDVDLYVKPDLFVTAFTNGLPRSTGRALAAGQRPLTYSAGTGVSGTPAWASIPSWYLVGTCDRVIPPAEQRIMAARAHARTVEVPAPHLSMLTHPAAVERLITAADHATR